MCHSRQFRCPVEERCGDGECECEHSRCFPAVRVTVRAICTICQSSPVQSCPRYWYSRLYMYEVRMSISISIFSSIRPPPGRLCHSPRYSPFAIHQTLSSPCITPVFSPHTHSPWRTSTDLSTTTLTLQRPTYRASPKMLSTNSPPRVAKMESSVSLNPCELSLHPCSQTPAFALTLEESKGML